MKYVFPTSLAVALVLVGATYFLSISPTPSSRAPVQVSADTTATPSAGVPTSTSSTYTATDVAQHASAASCWSSIAGNVYDLTPWISQHPGGAGAILSLCGTDGTAAFMAQHGGQGRPAAELKQFLLGPLQ
jgi:cytochrome b involved in lipid metabolism